MAESHIEELGKKDGQRPRKKKQKKWREEKEAEGLEKNYVKAQSAYIWYAKGMRWENKRKAQSAFEKKMYHVCWTWIHCIACICGDYLFILLVIDYFPSFTIHY